MKRFLLWTVPLLVAVVVTLLGYYGGSKEEAFPRAFALGFLTLLVGGGGTYLVVYFARMRQLDIRADELGADEVVWAKTSGSVAHYRSGATWKFWETVGGRLFLTNQVLEFRANPVEPWTYTIAIPLDQIRLAAPYNIFGFINGGLRIERLDGTFELFTFGAAFDLSQEWAHAIKKFRADLREAEDEA